VYILVLACVHTTHGYWRVYILVLACVHTTHGYWRVYILVLACVHTTHGYWRVYTYTTLHYTQKCPDHEEQKRMSMRAKVRRMHAGAKVRRMHARRMHGRIGATVARACMHGVCVCVCVCTRALTFFCLTWASGRSSRSATAIITPPTYANA
jgi:uncharacterized membrane protein